MGLIAADNFDVRSPLRSITKDEVRAAARHLGWSSSMFVKIHDGCWKILAAKTLITWFHIRINFFSMLVVVGLPNWAYAASPCLRSRLALGVEATTDHLQRIEQAELMVTHAFNLDATANMRVRLLAGNQAMIELDRYVLIKNSSVRLSVYGAYYFFFINNSDIVCYLPQ